MLQLPPGMGCQGMSCLVHEEGEPPVLEECQVLEAMGIRLREARHRSGLSQEAVAHLAHCATRSVTRWETGRCDLGIVMLSRLASICDVPVSWLVSGGAEA